MGPCLRRPKTNDRHDHMIQSQHSQHTVGRTAVAVVVLLCCAAAAVRPDGGAQADADAASTLGSQRPQGLVS
jgi:hypothetical protein